MMEQIFFLLVTIKAQLIQRVPLNIFWVFTTIHGGHGGRVVTLSPPTSEAGVRSP